MENLYSLFCGAGSIRTAAKLLFVKSYESEEKSSKSLEIIDCVLKKIANEVETNGVKKVLKGTNIRLTSKTKSKRKLNNYIRSFLVNSYKYIDNKKKLEKNIFKSDKFHSKVFDTSISDDEFENYLYKEAIEMLIKELSKKLYLDARIRYQNQQILKFKQSLTKFLKECIKEVTKDVVLQYIVNEILKLIKPYCNLKIRDIKSKFNKGLCHLDIVLNLLLLGQVLLNLDELS